MKKISKKPLDSVLLVISEVIILVTSFLCYLIKFSSTKGNAVFIPLLIGIVLLFLLTFCIQFLLIKRKNILINLTLVYAVLIFFSAVVLTVIFKIISTAIPESPLELTGLKSIIFLFAYYVFILLISLFNHLKTKEKEALTKKDI